jgi:hypothetical protein
MIYDAQINHKIRYCSAPLLYSNHILLCEKSANLYVISMRVLRETSAKLRRDQSVFAELSCCTDQIHICQLNCHLYSQQYAGIRCVNFKKDFLYIICLSGHLQEP